MVESSRIKIYVFYYKGGSVLKPDLIYQPIMAGNTLLSGNKTIPGDDTGENISVKNRYYCELTGIYWVWKNTSQEVIGACHYRRFFTAQPEPLLYKLKRILYYPLGLYKKRQGLIYTQKVKRFLPRILSREQLETLLLKYDAVLPQPRKLKYTVETHYSHYHNINDLKTLEAVLEDLYPDYLDAYHLVLKGKRLYANNMFVLKDINYQEFMNWWFNVLFEFERRIDLKSYNDYQKHILAFIAERLLTVWFEKKQLNCVELPVIYFKLFKFE